MCCETSKDRYCETIQCGSQKGNRRWNREVPLIRAARVVRSHHSVIPAPLTRLINILMFSVYCRH